MLEIKEQKFDIRFGANVWTIGWLLVLFAFDLWVMLTNTDILVGLFAFDPFVTVGLTNVIILLFVLAIQMIAKWCWNHIHYKNKGYETVIRITH